MFFDFLMQNFGWTVLMLVSAGRIIWLLKQSANDAQVTPAEATLLMNREHAILIDVRDAAERATGFIAKARNIPLEGLAQKVDDLEKYKAHPIVFYCASGKRSSKACDIMRKKGFDRVFSLAGGIDAWREANLPVSTK